MGIDEISLASSEIAITAVTPATGILSGKTVEDLTSEIKSYRTNKDKLHSLRKDLPPRYTTEFSCKRRMIGILAFVGVVSCFALYILFVNGGGFESFPENFVNAFKHINYKHLAIGLTATTVLVGGAAFVIYRAVTKKDRLLGASLGKMTGTQHIQEVVLVFIKNAEKKKEVGCIEGCIETMPQLFCGKTSKEKGPQKIDTDHAYLDTSTLDKNGTGKAYLYGVKPLGGHYSVSSVVTITTPLYTIGVIAWDAIRLVIVPFYILFCMSIELFTEKGLFEDKFEDERKFELKDIPLAMKDSLERIVKAPFYGTAYFFASLYSIFDPMNGRNVASFIERDWNEDVSRSEGFWSRQGPQELWPGLKIIAPNGLRRNFGGYMAGCWQPIGMVEITINSANEKEIIGMSLSKAVKPDSGKVYHVFTRTELEKA